MRIVLLTSAESSSGGARQAAYLAQDLAARGHDVLFFTPPGSTLRSAGFSIAWKDLPPAPRAWRRAVEECLPQKGPCVVQAFHNRAVKLLAWWSLLWRAQGRQAACFGYRGVVYMPRNPLPYLSPGMDGFVVNSRAGARVVRAISLGAARPVVIHNSIPARRLRPGREKAAILREASIAPHELVIGSVGWDAPVKGMQILIPAFARALREGALPADAKLLVVGTDRQKWLPMCESLGIAGSVHLAGDQRCVADYLQCMDIFALPSLSESFPNTLLEAMCMGVPVVASRVGGVPEVLSGTGELRDSSLFPGQGVPPGAEVFAGGVLVPPGDGVALARAIGLLAQNSALRRSMGAANLRQKEEFTGTLRVERFERLYQHALEKRGVFQGYSGSSPSM